MVSLVTQGQGLDLIKDQGMAKLLFYCGRDFIFFIEEWLETNFVPGLSRYE